MKIRKITFGIKFGIENQFVHPAPKEIELIPLHLLRCRIALAKRSRDRVNREKPHLTTDRNS